MVFIQLLSAHETLIPHSIFHDTLKNSYIQFSHVQRGDNAFIAGGFPTFQHVKCGVQAQKQMRTPAD